MRSKEKTPYCHMTYQNSKQKVFEARQALVRYAQQYGIKATVRYYGCSRQTVRTWLRRYEKARGASGLEDRRKGPHHIPHKTSQEEEEYIVACRNRAPCYGPKRLRWAYKIKASEGAIARILKTKGLTRKRRKKYQRKQDLREVKAQKYRSFDHGQLDVKHLYDIPYYWEQLYRLGLPKYQYTLRDTKSGFLVLGYGKEYSEIYSTIMAEYYLNHLKRCGISHDGVTIQTDNGSEFGGGKKSIKSAGFVNTIMCQYGANHQYIPPGLSNANADVESIHATIESEFFDLETFRSKEDFWTKIQAYQLFYNLVRPNYSKGGKPPAQIIFEEHPGLDSRILFFPVLDLDREFNMKYADKKETILGGQPLHKLPDFIFELVY